MIKSMTGYGRAIKHNEQIEISIEIQGLNRKNLEINCNTPRDWQGTERMIQDALRKKASRGKINVILTAKPFNETDAINWDSEAVIATLGQLKDLSQKLGTTFNITEGLILDTVKLVLSQKSGNDSCKWEECTEIITATLNEAIDAFCQMKESEGASLSSDLKLRLDILKTITSTIEQASEGTVARHRDLLLERLKQAELDIDLEDDRLLKELAFFADKSDTSEEITRLNSHFKQFHECLETKGPTGRKMDFLCQEIQRELNTIGSKANNIAITQQVIEGKNELERIREQVQNIE